jgi:hypothetical protein
VVVVVVTDVGGVVVVVLVVVVVVDVGVVVVDLPQDASNIAATSKKLRLNQMTLFFNFYLHFDSLQKYFRCCGNN